MNKFNGNYKKKNYFEEWYFKNEYRNFILSFILGLNIGGREKRARLFKL